MFDEYSRNARVYPALLILTPFFVLQFFYLNEKVNGWEDFANALKIVSIVSLPLVIFYFIVNASRLISKAVFERLYFKDSLHMPTTNFLLHSTNDFSKAHKASIRARLQNDFSVILATEAEEIQDPVEARRRIVEAVAYVRNDVKGGYLLLKHNIQYGFWRNLIGGSVIGLILCLLNIYVFKELSPQSLPMYLSVMLGSTYLLIILLSKWIMDYLGKLYAKRLYEEFMSKKYEVALANN